MWSKCPLRAHLADEAERFVQIDKSICGLTPKLKDETMKLYISADIEGIAGISHWDEASKNKPEYHEFRDT